MPQFTDEALEQALTGEEAPQRDDSGLLEFTEEVTEEKITAKLKKYNSTWKQFFSSYETKLKGFYNLYRNMEHTIEGVSVKVPEVFAIVETQLPHLLNSIFGQSQIIDAKAKYQDPEGQKTYRVKSYINQLIKDVCDGKAKSEIIIKNMLIYGWAVAKMYWNTKPNVDFDVMSGEIVETNSAHPDFDLVDPFCFAFDTTNQSLDIQNCEWVRERNFKTKNQLLQMRDSGECAWFNEDDMATGENVGRKVRDNTRKSEDKDKNTYYDEFWFTCYYKDEEGNHVSDEYIAWLLSDKKVIKFQKNPFKRKMFAITRAYSNPNEFLGMGEGEVIGPLANQLSLTHYQLGKTTKKVGQHLTVIDASAGISPENLRRVESGVLFVQNKGGIDFERTSDAQDIGMLVKVEEYLESKIEGITGIGKTLQGEAVGDITATQASYQYQNASNRIAMKLSHIQEGLIKVLAENFFLMNKQLLRYPVEFFDTNNNLIQLTPMDFVGNYDWIPMGSISQANKALQLSQNQQFIASLVQASQASMQTPKPFSVDLATAIEQYVAPYANMPNLSQVLIKLDGAPAQMGQVPSVPTQEGPNPPVQGVSPAVGVNSIQPEAVGNIEQGANSAF